MPVEMVSSTMLTARGRFRCLPAGRCVCGAGGGCTGRGAVEVDADAGVDVSVGGRR